MTSSNANIFCVTGTLCGEFTGHRWIPITKASDAEFWCFLWFAPEQQKRLSKQSRRWGFETPSCSLWRHSFEIWAHNITLYCNLLYWCDENIHMCISILNGTMALQWRHNEHDCVSNHQSHQCLLNRYLGADQRKHQSSASLAFVRGSHRRPVNSPHKGPVTRKMFPFDDVIMGISRSDMARDSLAPFLVG